VLGLVSNSAALDLAGRVRREASPHRRTSTRAIEFIAQWRLNSHPHSQGTEPAARATGSRRAWPEAITCSEASDFRGRYRATQPFHKDPACAGRAGSFSSICISPRRGRMDSFWEHIGPPTESGVKIGRVY